MEQETTLSQEELNTRLKQAMFNHDYTRARLLVDEGADPNTTNNWGAPFIYWCAEKGKTDLIDVALRKGADINGTNKSGETALHRAAYVGKTDVIDHLIDRGAAINQGTMYNATPLFIAVLRQQAAAVEKLLARGADRSICNSSGVSAAEKALELGQDAIASLLAAE